MHEISYAYNNVNLDLRLLQILYHLLYVYVHVLVYVLYMYFTFKLSALKTSSSLWVGTNGGHVFIYSLTVPEEKRTENEVAAVLAKEIKLRHKAPVISIGVVDGKSRVLPDPLEVENSRAKAPEGNNHTVVICSEEQLKVG